MKTYKTPTVFDSKLPNGKQRKLYISSKMTGIIYYNFPDFYVMEAQMICEGWDVVNPAKIDADHGIDPFSLPDDWDWNKPPPNTTYEELLERDLEELKQCDAILLFGDWENSNGANVELAKAIGIGLDIYEL